MNPETGTEGWAIVVRNPLPNGDPNLTPAVQFCSDSGCSAATQSCVSFNPNADVYFNVRPGGELLGPSGSGPGNAQTVYFHDPTPSCNSPIANACDKIYDVRLITCKGGSNPVYTTTCNANPHSCVVQIGN